VGNGGAGAGEARGTEESGAGQQVRGTWPAKAAGFTGASRAEEGELEVGDRGYSVILQKYRGSTVKLS
jgi:hypothetical protein